VALSDAEQAKATFTEVLREMSPEQLAQLVRNCAQAVETPERERMLVDLPAIVAIAEILIPPSGEPP
jgi:hypothetical protein